MAKSKKTIFALVVVLVVALGVSLCACNDSSANNYYNTVVSITKTKTEGLVDTYTITFSDGSTYDFTVTNGRNGVDGEDGTNAKITVEDLYEAAKTAGYTGTLADFINENLQVTAPEAVSSMVSKAAYGTVLVVSNFTKSGASSEKYASAGSGIIYKLDKEKGNAYVVTNYHVVYDSGASTSDHVSDNVEIMLYGSEYLDCAIPATYVGGSMTYDIAVLKIENSEFLKSSNATEAVLGSSESVSAGDAAIAIGNAKGSGTSVTAGIVSIDSEYLEMTAADEKTAVTYRVMRIDTPVNKGNSGGGLFNAQGEVIGIVNAKNVESTVESIGYAIPVDLVKKVVDNLLYYNVTTGEKNGYKPVLGITVSGLDSKAVYDAAKQKSVVKENVTVKSVAAGTAAETAGFKEGDVITKVKIGGKEYETDRMYKLIDLVLLQHVGDEVEYTVLRGGETVTITWTVTAGQMTKIS